MTADADSATMAFFSCHTMLYILLKDMTDIFRLRYKPAQAYRYSFAAASAVLFLMGMVNAAAFSVFWGPEPAITVFVILLTVCRWLLLGRAMRAVLSQKGNPPLPLWGFTLSSEALGIPLLILLYLPQLGFIGIIWQIWTFWTQALGFCRLGQAPMSKVITGYVLFALSVLVVSFVMLLLFSYAGWLDTDLLYRRLQTGGIN